MSIDTRLYDRILLKVTPQLRRGRPGDYLHTTRMYRTLRAYYRGRRYRFEPRIAFPAVILHDCGFGFIKQTYMSYFTGQQKVMTMRDVVNQLTLAYVKPCLADFSFTAREIRKISECIRHGDQEVLSEKQPSIELILLHDLNLLDRFSAQRVAVLRQLYPSREKRVAILDRSLRFIILPDLKQDAKELLKKRMSGQL